VAVATIIYVSSSALCMAFCVLSLLSLFHFMENVSMYMSGYVTEAGGITTGRQ